MTTDIFKNQNISIQEFPVDSGSRFGSDIMRAVKEFQVGSGDLSFNANQSGIWLGGKTFGTAPFAVDMHGVLYASAAVITGYLEDGEAASDVNNNTTTINGGKITTGSITANEIAAHTITGDEIVAYVALSAPAITGGTIDGGTITGALIRTSSGDNRIEFSSNTYDNAIVFYALGSVSGAISSTHPQTELEYSGVVLSSSNFIYNDLSLSGNFIVSRITPAGVEIKLLQVGNEIAVGTNIIPLFSGLDIGDSSNKFSDIYLSGNVYVAGTVDGVDLSSKASVWDAKMSNPMTTQGDIIYGGYLGSPARLGIGSDGQVLMVNAIGGINWVTMQHTDLGGVSANQHHSSTSNGLSITPSTIVASSYITATGYLTAKSILYCEDVIHMNSHRITNVANPTSDQDAATKKWVEDNFAPL